MPWLDYLWLGVICNERIYNVVDMYSTDYIDKKCYVEFTQPYQNKNISDFEKDIRPTNWKFWTPQQIKNIGTRGNCLICLNLDPPSILKNVNGTLLHYSVFALIEAPRINLLLTNWNIMKIEGMKIQNVWNTNI